MDYSGPQASDFANVASLNYAFLLRLRSRSRDSALPVDLPDALRQRIVAIRDPQLERLASSPFLLLSIREHDEACWRRAIDQARQPDMLQAGTSCGAEIATVAASFLWHLARRRPYAARLLAGASPAWCRLVAGCTLLSLLAPLPGRAGMLQPRLAGDAYFWSKLLGPGLSANGEVRHAAQLACLQSMLTATAPAAAPVLRAAACKPPVPVRTASLSRDAD